MTIMILLVCLAVWGTANECAVKAGLPASDPESSALRSPARLTEAEHAAAGPVGGGRLFPSEDAAGIFHWKGLVFRFSASRRRL